MCTPIHLHICLLYTMPTPHKGYFLAEKLDKQGFGLVCENYLQVCVHGFETVDVVFSASFFFVEFSFPSQQTLHCHTVDHILLNLFLYFLICNIYIYIFIFAHIIYLYMYAHTYTHIFSCGNMTSILSHPSRPLVYVWTEVLLQWAACCQLCTSL